MIYSSEKRLTHYGPIGLSVTVIKSSNPLNSGVKGVVIDETKNMLVIADNDKKRYFPKEYTTYGFTMSDGSFIEVNGRQLLGRPVDRIGKIWKRRRK